MLKAASVEEQTDLTPPRSAPRTMACSSGHRRGRCRRAAEARSLRPPAWQVRVASVRDQATQRAITQSCGFQPLGWPSLVPQCTKGPKSDRVQHELFIQPVAPANCDPHDAGVRATHLVRGSANSMVIPGGGFAGGTGTATGVGGPVTVPVLMVKSSECFRHEKSDRQSQQQYAETGNDFSLNRQSVRLRTCPHRTRRRASPRCATTPARRPPPAGAPPPTPPP